ncbi:MAG: hypothetical protein NTZ72_19355 [Afipia sp.]|nr:hypothetical protein [Afipia sp.]
MRRRVAIAETESEAQELLEGVIDRLRNTLAKDPRASLKAVPDAPQKGTGFSLSEDEFISGTPDRVLEQIIHQCKELGAGHFLAVIHWGAPYDDVARGHELFAKINPELRRAAI